ncbi:hypothetical protein TKK_0007572 [Trichogramma kaykai]|uniref:Uncharacterized protein n=1 Tax=Trichogramma kaykai TaxID=54128 RepID=A0ABD2WGZ0_9HYME
MAEGSATEPAPADTAATTESFSSNRDAVLPKISASLKRAATSPPSPLSKQPQLIMNSKTEKFSTPKPVDGPKAKRFKQRLDKMSISDIKVKIEPAVTYLKEKNCQYPLNTEKLIDFLCKSYGAPKILPLANEFTEDIEGLKLMLRDTKLHIKCINLKARITRIIRKLSNQDASDYMSDSSCTSASEL